MDDKSQVKIKNIPIIIGLFAAGLWQVVLPWQAQAQVTIKERMELKKTAQHISSSRQTNQAVNTGGRILHQLAPGTYIVLKSGRLHFYTGIATTASRIQQAVTMSISSFAQSIDTTLTIGNHFIEPIQISDSQAGSCREEYFYGRTATYTLAATQDTYFEGSNQKGSDQQFLYVSRFDYALVQFDLNTVTTNGDFGSASLGLTLRTRRDTLESESFRITPILESWDEMNRLDDALPATDASLSLPRSFSAAANGFTTDFDISAIAAGWFNGSRDNFGVMLSNSSDSVTAFRSRENFTPGAVSTEPRLGIRVRNPNADLPISRRRIEYRPVIPYPLTGGFRSCWYPVTAMIRISRLCGVSYLPATLPDALNGWNCLWI